ncbi:MAG TPA: hypothetical protein VNJ47_07215 [Nevskiales bacterium]|nr:hypothetical protein [Nevskiales bacterium]
MKLSVVFRAGWLGWEGLERSLSGCTRAFGEECDAVEIHVANDCKVMVDAGIRLLSYVNQLADSGRAVALNFSSTRSNAYTYLNRLGFFDHLNPGIDVIPQRPSISGAKKYGGSSVALVEIAPIKYQPGGAIDRSLPGRLADSVAHWAEHQQAGAGDRIHTTIFTAFAELVDNIYQHSETRLDGFAALQTYAQSNSVMVAVSDSGRGVLNTLRPALMSEFPTLVRLSDTDLMVELFRQGLSRHGRGRGAGLKRSADCAIRLHAELNVRLERSMVHLLPSQDGYRPHRAQCLEGRPSLPGTHIGFMFRLDEWPRI